MCYLLCGYKGVEGSKVNYYGDVRSCFGKTLFISNSMYIYMPAYICDKLFAKTQSMNLELTLQAHLIGIMLIKFW